MILAIGYGAFGRKVVNCAKKLDKLTIIDVNEDVFESLGNGTFNHIVGDAGQLEVLNRAKITEADTILIMTNNNELNRKIAELVQSINDKAYVIVRGIVKYPELYEGLNVDKVIYPLESAAKDVVHEIQKSKLRRKLLDLRKVVEDAKAKYNNLCGDENNLEDCCFDAHFLIMLHNNPDPDAMASAMALKTILDRWGASSKIAYAGKIGYDENKAMVNLLGIKLKNILEVDMDKYCGIAVVDSSSYNSLYSEIDRSKEMNILIDHHKDGDIAADYSDIQSEAGATATIITTYLIQLGIEPDRHLATALYYAIVSDTNNFKRNASKMDFEIASYLQGLMDTKVLEMIENPEIETETMDVLAKAISNRKIIKGNIALSYVGNIKNRDALPRAADFLLKMEGIYTTYIFGIADDNIHISARTKDLRVDLGTLMNEAFMGGGHQASAAACIPLGIFESVSDKVSLRQLVEEAIQNKILSTMGIYEDESSNSGSE
ncbi:nanoRNase/pAp phosphatase (c-di-AMP/oligoRNAs hydrolase) [Methanococcus voltae]|uniref:DHH family phosphoesterase n=1 Tax=Methanococcus voltae TaxID=2188 RepID=UPI001AE8E6C4|nr:DHH family phosphoesterase [Methanococcus voltae]MBP2143316.1 nanoRNase/pAp phosphatase (c-di-AMP/oligoRNAs hydrolase) [Methanococcus voltae]